MATQEKKEPGAPTFIALRAAAAMAYTAATRQTTADSRKLNKVARIVAECVPIFSRRAQPEPAPVQPAEIREGRFERGGEQLRFADGRPPLTELAIVQQQLPIAIAAVREAIKSWDDPRGY
jgi:hypothetical protein